MQSSQGFDNASHDRSKDDLHRWRFALDIAEVIKSTPIAWSVRIGLFGSWGSGKTTVLRYINSFLSDSRDIVINFNPAFEQDLSGALGFFGGLLIEELAKRKLYVEPKVKSLLRKSRWFNSGITSDVMGSAGDLFKGAKVAGVGYNALLRWLKPSGDQIKKISEMLPNQRIVVLIDDLDRCSPELLPKFLLSLRELFDIPHFVFVLAFDDVIVANALLQQNDAWSEGQDFLEKILDFRFSLPPIDSEGKRLLLKRALQENAAFVPLESSEAIADLIPDNPRKLKALVRGFRSVRETIERHNPNEFDWTDLWLIQLLQQESHLLVSQLADENNYSEVIGISYRLLYSNAGRKSSIKTPDKTTLLINKVNIAQSSLDRVTTIIEAMRSRSTLSMLYTLRWFLRPPAVTWKEFDQFLACWGDARTPESLRGAMETHAAKRNDSLDRVQDEVFEAMSNRMHEILDKAFRNFDMNDAIEDYARVDLIRNAAHHFLQIPGTLTSKRFCLLYNNAQRWATIHNDNSSLAARDAERRLLLVLASNLTSTEAIATFESLALWSERPLGYEGVNAAERVSLRQEITDIVRPAVEAALSEFLLEPNSFRKLAEVKKFSSFKALLFQQSTSWSVAVWDAVSAVFIKARVEKECYLNVFTFLDLLVSALDYRVEDISCEQVKGLLKNDQFVGELWAVLLSRKLLPAGLIRLLGQRAKLLEAGAPVDKVPLNGSLEEQMAMFEQNKDAIMSSL